MKLYKKIKPFVAFAFVGLTFFSNAQNYNNKNGLKEDSTRPFSVPAAGTIDIAFSPDEGAEKLVLKVIKSAHAELDIMAYSFTNIPIANALLDALHNGVRVNMVVDKNANIDEDKSGLSHAALKALKTAGAQIELISVYPIAHDKVIIADRNTVELGSFNYSAAAAHKNSEIVEVNWNNPTLADVVINHFIRNWKEGYEFKP